MKQIVLLVTALLLFACTGEQNHGDDYTDRMAHEHHGETPSANESADYEPSVTVTSKAVEYGTTDEQTFVGYFAEPADGGDNLPGVVLIHEWWGLNDNIQKMSRRLAGEGFRVLAVDFYGGETAENSDQAQRLMRAAMENQDNGLINLEQAAAYLKNSGSQKTAVMGWCFGGAWTLNAAIGIPEEFDAGVIYYGRVNTNPEDLERIQIPLLGIFGAEDRGIPVEQVTEFKQTLNRLDKNVDIYIYEEADHAFANPSGTRYNPDAAADAWIKTLDFLELHLK